MGSIRFKRVAVPLAAVVLGAAPAAAVATPLIDYSKNGATGTYQAQVTHKNYALNGATGDVARAPIVAQPSVRGGHVPQSQGFAWGAAAVGAAASLLVMAAVGVAGRRIRRRQIQAPTPARATAA
jgi:hypothetical protein